MIFYRPQTTLKQAASAIFYGSVGLALREATRTTGADPDFYTSIDFSNLPETYQIENDLASKRFVQVKLSDIYNGEGDSAEHLKNMRVFMTTQGDNLEVSLLAHDDSEARRFSKLALITDYIPTRKTPKKDVIRRMNRARRKDRVLDRAIQYEEKSQKRVLFEVMDTHNLNNHVFVPDGKRRWKKASPWVYQALGAAAVVGAFYAFGPELAEKWNTASADGEWLAPLRHFMQTQPYASSLVKVGLAGMLGGACGRGIQNIKTAIPIAKQGGVKAGWNYLWSREAIRENLVKPSKVGTDAVIWGILSQTFPWGFSVAGIAGAKANAFVNELYHLATGVSDITTKVGFDTPVQFMNQQTGELESVRFSLDSLGKSVAICWGYGFGLLFPLKQGLQEHFRRQDSLRKGLAKPFVEIGKTAKGVVNNERPIAYLGDRGLEALFYIAKSFENVYEKGSQKRAAAVAVNKTLGVFWKSFQSITASLPPILQVPWAAAGSLLLPFMMTAMDTTQGTGDKKVYETNLEDSVQEVVIQPKSA